MAPVSPPGIASTPLVTNVDARAPAQQTASVASEQRLIDFVARLQSQGLAPQAFNNPAGIASEALRGLEGYFERAKRVSDRMSRNVKRADGMDEETKYASLTNPGGETLLGGPARQALDAASASGNESVERADELTLGELERLYDRLVDMARYNAETAFVSTASNNVSKSVMTLVRGA